MANGNTWPSFGTPPPAYNLPQPDYGYLKWADQGYPRMNNYQMYMPSSGGSGWASDMARLGGTGMIVGGPAGAAIGAGLGLLGGVLGGISAGKKKKQARQTLEKGQKAYQSRAEQLFPELSKSSFQFQSPQQSNAINAGLSYMLSNMFGKWGMPQGMNEGYGNMAQFFQGLMPGTPGPAMAAPPPQGQASPPRGGMGGGQGAGGGWMNDFRRNRNTNPRQMFAI